jgi:hypothetical protein
MYVHVFENGFVEAETHGENTNVLVLNGIKPFY